MKGVPRISESEWQVMRVVWGKAPRTANEVVEELAASTTWKPKTIKTLLNRLVKKKALGFKKKGKAYHYYPLSEEAECVRAESHSFLRRVYGGALMPMLANFIQDQGLSPEEIAELRHILDERQGSE